MNPPNQMPEALREISERWSMDLESISGHEGRLAYLQNAMPDLLLNRAVFAVIFKNITDGGQYPDIRQATMFPNEMLLYADSKRMFSIRLYLWSRGEYTPIHDHNAWGLIGPVVGDFEVINYARKDTGSREDCARLEERNRLILAPGQTEIVLPLNNGIHRTGNPTDMTAATVHVYGNPVRRTYINSFDMETGRIQRIYAPRAQKRMLASEALRALEDRK